MSSREPAARPEVEPESLENELTHVLEEARMILPGLQALFGFQLIAVFNPSFDQRLAPSEQRLHLLALCLVAAAVGFVMAPAAYHRQAERGQVSRRLVDFASGMIAWGLVLLMLGICIDLYLIASLILSPGGPALGVAGMLLALFSGLWFVYPRIARRAAARRGTR